MAFRVLGSGFIELLAQASGRQTGRRRRLGDDALLFG